MGIDEIWQDGIETPIDLLFIFNEVVKEQCEVTRFIYIKSFCKAYKSFLQRLMNAFYRIFLNASQKNHFRTFPSNIPLSTFLSVNRKKCENILRIARTKVTDKSQPKCDRNPEMNLIPYHESSYLIRSIKSYCKKSVARIKAIFSIAKCARFLTPYLSESQQCKSGTNVFLFSFLPSLSFDSLLKRFRLSLINVYTCSLMWNDTLKLEKDKDWHHTQNISLDFRNENCDFKKAFSCRTAMPEIKLV